MRKPKLLIAVLGMLALTGTAFGADLAAVPWDKAHLDTLRSFSAADVDRLTEPDVDPDEIPPGTTVGDDIQEFTWATLTGGQQEHLVVVMRPLGSGGGNYVGIYAKSPTGKIIDEGGAEGQALSLKGNFAYIGDLIQDVDGDGKDELVVPTKFGFGVYNAAPAAIWPQVYKLQNGKYVEGSRDFAKFYDTKVLPELNSEIAAAREPAAREAQMTPDAPFAQRPAKQILDVLIMARDKILRVIGRDPKAGEQQARDWVYGPDPDPWFAGFVFKDMGGHEEDLKAARREMHRENQATDARVRREAGSNAQH